ncbi:alpha/beta fold hydrolase [Saccharothrix carnea]|uniref:alpha/beta fold hydrolase n=1 Tax=Saccharothrix carnea TaxID=1280637 RepID=UPI0015E75C74|nr:alpha/beta hydrolase [Saccharothrix carnea]
MAVRYTDSPDRSRTPVLLVHGMVASTRYLAPTMARLARDRAVVAPDLPGVGNTPRSGPPASMYDDAEVLGGVLAAGAGPAFVVAHSGGCHSATELALRNPDLIRYLVLVSPPQNRRAPSAIIARWTWAMAHEPPSLVRDLLREGLRCGPRMVWAAFRDLCTYRLEAALPQVRCPVLVVRGTKDPLLSRTWAAHLAGLARDGRHVEVRGGHSLPYTAPEHLVETVSGAVSDLDRTLHGRGTARSLEQSSPNVP